MEKPTKSITKMLQDAKFYSTVDIYDWLNDIIDNNKNLSKTEMQHFIFVRSKIQDKMKEILNEEGIKFK